MFSLRIGSLALTAITALSIAAARPVAAQTYDASRDFSASTNPNRTWSYGYEHVLGGPFTLYSVQLSLGNSTFGWDAPDSVAYAPLVMKNFGSSPDTFADVYVRPGQLFFHPGNLNQNSIVRWTAPKTGLYQVSASFSPVTVDGTTTDVHVSISNVPVFNGFVLGSYLVPLAAPTYDTVVRLKKGTVVDFAVGFGPDGNFFGDSTGLEATITRLRGTGDGPDQPGDESGNNHD